MDWCRTSCATSKYAGDGSVLTDVKAVRRRRRREDMEGARYVTRLSRLSAFGAIVAITVAALLMGSAGHASAQSSGWMAAVPLETGVPGNATGANRSEEHTSELQSLRHLVCRLLLEKKNTT